MIAQKALYGYLRPRPRVTHRSKNGQNDLPSWEEKKPANVAQ